MNIVLIGAGNVATQLGVALQANGFPVIQVYSRTLASAKRLGEKLQTAYTDALHQIVLDAGLYIFAVNDSVLPAILKAFPAAGGLWVHTAGSVSMDVFKESRAERYGVLYPLQTFSRNRDLSFAAIPVFIEANRPEDEQLLENIALALSGKVTRLSSEKRKHLHLAAVFACNFTNHLYASAAKILEEQDLPWDVLLPLIEETAAKVRELHPKEAQTGPAVRYDTDVMNKHLELLKDDPDQQEIYRILSRNIHQLSETETTVL
jgi:predicted short-subunit dehydrogenase-like oxidoreductase (DUF2520 family)